MGTRTTKPARWVQRDGGDVERDGIGGSWTHQITLTGLTATKKNPSWNVDVESNKREHPRTRPQVKQAEEDREKRERENDNEARTESDGFGSQKKKVGGEEFGRR